MPSAANRKRLAIHHPRRGGSDGADPGGIPPDGGSIAGGVVTVLNASDMIARPRLSSASRGIRVYNVQHRRSRGGSVEETSAVERAVGWVAEGGVRFVAGRGHDHDTPPVRVGECSDQLGDVRCADTAGKFEVESPS